jgi:Tfp pilus assembly PilM family ATPase
MGLLGTRTRSVVGLDIEPGFIAAAQASNGGQHPTLERAATGPLQPGLFHEGEVTDVDGLADQLRTFFRDNDLPKVVRLGVASQKVVVRLIELPATVMEREEELDQAVRFQAQEELPMPLEQAVLDHRVVEKFSDGENTLVRVLMVAARRDTVEHILAVARKAGLNTQLIDLSAFAIVRALYVPPHGQTADGQAHGSGNGAQQQAQADAAAADAGGARPSGDTAGSLAGAALEPAGEAVVSGDVTYTPADASQQPAQQPEQAAGHDPLKHLLPDQGADAQAAQATEMPSIQPSGEVGQTATLYCHVSGLTNLAIATGADCVFTRVLQNSVESMAAALAEQKGLTLEHARQWLRHVGLEKDVGAIEGEGDIVAAAREVLQSGAHKTADEVRLSLEYYQTSVANAQPVERVVLAGQVIAIPGFAPVLEREVGLAVEPRSLGALDVRPGALDGVDGSQLTVAAGLAIDEVRAA